MFSDKSKNKLDSVLCDLRSVGRGDALCFKFYSERLSAVGRSARTLRASNSPMLPVVHLTSERSRRQWRLATAGDLAAGIVQTGFSPLRRCSGACFAP